mgnify:CR=1 FL=1
MSGPKYLALAGAAILSMGLGFSSAVNAQTIRIPHCCAADSHFDVAAERFADLLAEKTNGEIQGEVFPSGQLGQETEVIQNVQSGSIEATIIGHDPLAQFAEETTILSLPYLFDNHDQAFEQLDGELGERLGAILSERGLRVLAWGNNGARVYTNDQHSLESPQDFVGLKFRSPENPVNLAVTEALGGIAAAIPYGEVYTALQQGTIDGQENAVINIYPANLQEVQSYMSMTNHLLSFVVLVMNENYFNSLSPEMQTAVQEAASEAMAEERATAQTSADEMTALMQEAGVEVTEPDLAPFREMTQSIHDEYVGSRIPQDLYDLAVGATN